MNSKSALHVRIYNRLEIDSPVKAMALIHMLDDFGLMDGARFGTSEPIREAWGSNTAATAVAMLNTHRSFMFKNPSRQFELYISWFRARMRPWFWTMDLGRTWLRPAAQTSLISLCERIIVENDIDLLSCAKPEDWFQKHDLFDAYGAVQLRGGAGMEIGKGLPGIYWLNGFGPALYRHFEAKLPAVERLATVDLKDSDRLMFRTYPSAADGTAESRRQAEQAIVEVLGAEYFFELPRTATSRQARRQSVRGVTDATKL